MTKTMKIEGMMCGHCEARVKKCLEALEQVSEAVVSHEAGTAVLTLSAEVSDEELRKTVEAQDYKVLSVEQAVNEKRAFIYVIIGGRFFHTGVQRKND